VGASDGQVSTVARRPRRKPPSRPSPSGEGDDWHCTRCALHYLLLTQSELERSEFKALLGLGERLATAQVTALLKRWRQKRACGCFGC
jgi:hypothetical protein